MTLQEFLAEWQSPSPTISLHTSGSTGAPKTLLAEKTRMQASARTTCTFLGLKPGHTALLCLPLDYIAGKMMVVRALECKLALHTIAPTTHPLSAQNLPTQIDLCAMVTPQVAATLASAEERKRLASIKHLLIGGGAIPPQMEAQLQNVPCTVWSSYGMTETLSHIALRRVNGPSASTWYTPLPGVDITLSPSGCLIIHAPALCPEPLTTNDLAEIQHTPTHTLFRILGRRDNTICSGGLKIQIEEIEKRLAPHLHEPFMITKCPSPKLGEQVVLLSLNPNTTSLQALCATHLPRHWQPREIYHVDQLPVTPTGKPARKEAEKLAMRMIREI